MTHKEIKLIVKTAFLTVMTLIAAAGMAYLVWCWSDVLDHQLDGGTNNPYNVFFLLTEGTERMK